MKTASEIFRAVLELLGPNGEYWTKGIYSKKKENGDICYCAVGAMCEVTGPGNARNFLTDRAIVHALGTTGIENVVAFNDAAETTFTDVKAFFERAIAFAEYCGG